MSHCTWIPGSSHECLQASEDLRLRVWDTRTMTEPAQIVQAAHNNIMTCCDAAVRPSPIGAPHPTRPCHSSACGARIIE